MEAMSLRLPRRGRPFTERIDSKLTRDVEMKERPRGQPCTVRFRWCSVNFMRENRVIGGETTRKVVYNDELEGQEVDVAHPVHGGPAVLRSKSACHDAIRQMLAEVLPALIESHVDTEDANCWDEFVPAGLVDDIVARALGDAGSYACDVWMHVTVTRVFSEAEELLLFCEAAAVTPSDAARRPAPGAGDACVICTEELTDGGVTSLPDCSHAFHRECILKWFGKAPTCPCCRRDMMHYLNHRQRAAAIASTAAAISSAEGAALLTSLEIAAVERANSSSGAAAIAIRRRLRRAAPYVNRSDGGREPVQRGVVLDAVGFAGDDAPDEQLFQRVDLLL